MSISRTKEQEKQEKARTRIQCVRCGMNELSRRRRRDAGLPQLTAETFAASTDERVSGETGKKTRATKQEAAAGQYGGDRLEFRVGRRSRPLRPSPNPRPRPTLAESLRLHLRFFLCSPPSTPHSRSSPAPRVIRTHNRSLGNLAPRVPVSRTENRGPAGNCSPESVSGSERELRADESGPESSSRGLITQPNWRTGEPRKSEEERRIAVEGGRDGRREESPRAFGPCLSSSFVPKLRLFSWPSFSRFVHPWVQNCERKSERMNERKRVNQSRAGKRTKHTEEEEES
ncbi:hypothetical protein PUN28_001836 [Cardiocondyla obscurior]|uniref:Uncharacterized protein n=1 Tax=Cardiocondyla obscurior TaxID=286306 RepID=A0AAW2GRH2_9HYME